MVSKFSHGFCAKSKFLTQKSILNSSITRKGGRKNQEVKLLTKICALLSCLMIGKCRLVHHSSKKHSAVNHGLRTPRQSFFSKIRNFWAWADKLGRNFMRHLGYFWPNYKHYFGTVSPLSMGKCSWFSFLQKTLVFRCKTYNSQLLPK